MPVAFRKGVHSCKLVLQRCGDGLAGGESSPSRPSTTRPSERAVFSWIIMGSNPRYPFGVEEKNASISDNNKPNQVYTRSM